MLFQGPHRGHGTGRSYIGSGAASAIPIGCYTYVWRYYLIIFLLSFFIYFSLTLRIFHTPHFPHSAFPTLLIFHTRHFPHSAFSTLLIFHTPHFLHSAFSTLRIFHTPHSALHVFHLAKTIAVKLVGSQNVPLQKLIIPLGN